MAEKIARELTVQGVKNIIVYNLSYADISNVIRDIFKYDTLIVGSPTYNGELFPEVGSPPQNISERCIPCRKFAYFGSYTWAGAAVRLLGEFAQKMKWEAICQPTEMKQGYDDQGAQCCTALAKAIAEIIRQNIPIRPQYTGTAPSLAPSLFSFYLFLSLATAAQAPISSPLRPPF